jgi:protein associated with RNAse G/E
MASGEVRVVFRKYDGSLHWHQTMHRLGEDEFGVWLGAPAGMVTRKADGPSIVVQHDEVMLLPREGWWTGSFNAPPSRLEIYCDIGSPPEWPSVHQVTMIDLDLDVCRVRADGKVVLLDEDEFAVHRVHYGYPPEVAEQASAAAAWLYEALGDGTEPFATRYLDWLSKIG